MATIALTDPRLQEAATLEGAVANEAIVIGNLIFIDAANAANVAVNNDAAKNIVAGMAITNAAAGEYVVYVPTGTIVKFAETLTRGQVYILADTLGAVKLSNEIATNEFLSEFGKVTDDNTITINLDNTGTQAA